jgi:hypothetical protein
MLNSTFFVLGLLLGTFIFAHVLVKYHLEAFVALCRSSNIFCQNQILQFAKSDSSVLTDLLRRFFLDRQLYFGIFLQPKNLL